MQTETYIEELRKSSVTSLWLFGLLTSTIVVLLVVLALYVIRLNESHLFINCNSFSSYSEMEVFLKENPTYVNRFDRNNDGKPCEKLK